MGPPPAGVGRPVEEVHPALELLSPERDGVGQRHVFLRGLERVPDDAKLELTPEACQTREVLLPIHLGLIHEDRREQIIGGDSVLESAHEATNLFWVSEIGKLGGVVGWVLHVGRKYRR